MFDSQANITPSNPPQQPEGSLSSYCSTAALSFPSTVTESCTAPKKTITFDSKKYVNMAIPESKSEDILSNHLLFSCDIQCVHSIKYSFRGQEDPEKYKQFDLDKLDIILGPSSTLNIQCIFLLNGLDNVLNFPVWIDKPLNKVMENSGFRLLKSSKEGDITFQYHVNKAFVTSPLSYLFDKQAPFGVLEKLDVVFDWSASNMKEFQSCWNRKKLDDLYAFIEYMDYALTSILIRKSFYLYPLIFSSFYTKRITQTMAYLPYISQSLQKIYTTSKATMSVSNHEFSESFMRNIKTINQNTKIMNPHSNNGSSTTTTTADQELSPGQITTALTLGMYHSIKNANKPKMSLKKSDTQNPPNALYTVAQLWSITCSTSSSE